MIAYVMCRQMICKTPGASEALDDVGVGLVELRLSEGTVKRKPAPSHLTLFGADRIWTCPPFIYRRRRSRPRDSRDMTVPIGSPRTRAVS